MRQAESFRSALSDDNREQTRQLVHLIRKETERWIAQERGEVEKQMLEQRQGIINEQDLIGRTHEGGEDSATKEMTCR